MEIARSGDGSEDPPRKRAGAPTWGCYCWELGLLNIHSRRGEDQMALFVSRARTRRDSPDEQRLTCAWRAQDETMVGTSAAA